MALFLDVFLKRYLLVSIIGFSGEVLVSQHLLAQDLPKLDVIRVTETAPNNNLILLNRKSNSYPNVSELTDISYQDWAFGALKFLADRYKCLTGYPNLTYQGDRPLTRYEFAAAVKACGDRLTQKSQTSLADKVSATDLLTLQKLQSDFAAELSSLTNQIIDLETKTTNLEANSFSPTTKLSGVAIMSIAANHVSNPNIAQPALDNTNSSVFSTQLNSNTNAIAIV